MPREANSTAVQSGASPVTVPDMTRAGSGKGHGAARACPGRDLGQYLGATLSTTGAEAPPPATARCTDPCGATSSVVAGTPKTAAVPAAMAAVSSSNAVAFCIASVAAVSLLSWSAKRSATSRAR